MSKLTVALCTYNRAKFLKDAINGILNQTYQDFDFVIYDNASTDNTEEVVGAFNNPRIKYLKFNENTGMTGNWLRAVKGCETEYLSIAHDDDIYEPTLLEKEIAVMEKNPGVMLVSCKAQYVGEDNEVFEGVCNSTFTEDVLYGKYGLFRDMVYKDKGADYITAPAAMFRTSCLSQIDYGFFETAGITADFCWYLRINELGGVYILHEPLVRYRLHGGQYSAERLEEAIAQRDTILPIMAERLKPAEVEELRVCYDKEIEALTFIRGVTSEINGAYKGLYLPGKLYADEGLLARIKLLSHLSKGNPVKYVIWGASIVGYKNKRIFDVLLPNYELAGFIDKRKRGTFEGYPIFPSDEYDFSSRGEMIVICTTTGAYDITRFLEGRGLEFKKDFILGNLAR